MTGIFEQVKQTHDLTVDLQRLLYVDLLENPCVTFLLTLRRKQQSRYET